MKKTLLSLLITIIIIVLLAPLGVGYWIKSQYLPQYLDQYKQSYFLQGALENIEKPEVTEFDLGWFSSVAKIKIQGKNTQTGKTITHLLTFDIQQGPILLPNNHQGLGMGFARWTLHAPKFPAQLQIVATVGFTGTTSLHVALPQYSYQEDDKQITINGFSGNIQINSDGTYSGGHINLKHLAFRATEENNAQLTINDLKAKASVDQVLEHVINLGTSSVNIGEISFRDNTLGSFALQNVQFSQEDQLNDDKINSQMTLKLQKLKIMEKEPVSVVIHANINGYDSDSMVRLVKAIKILNQTTMSLPSTLEQVLPAVNHLLEKGLAYSINIDVDTAQDKTHVILKATLPDSSQSKNTLAGLPPKAEFLMLAQHISANLAIRMPKALTTEILSSAMSIEKTIMQDRLNTAIKLKLIQEDKKDYTFHAKYEDNSLLVNGLSEDQLQLNLAAFKVMLDQQEKQTLNKSVALHPTQAATTTTMTK